MTLEIKHATQIVGDGSGESEVGKTAWNQPLNATMATGRLLGRVADGDGAVEELTPEQVQELGIGGGSGQGIRYIGATEPDTTDWAEDDLWLDTSTEA